MTEAKKELMRELRAKHWQIRQICLSGKTLEYLSLDERVAFTKLTYDMDKQIDAFEKILLV